MRTMLVGIVLVGLLVMGGSAQSLYALYHDCSYPPGGVENGTRLYIANPNDTGVQYSLTVYSPQGVSLGSMDAFVNAHSTGQIWLADLISGDRTQAWGLCTVRRAPGYPADLHVVAERYSASTLLDYDPVPSSAVSGYHTFFYNAWHSAGGPENDTHLCILNPTDTANGYRIEIYDVNGDLIGSRLGVINPGCTAVHRLSELIHGARDATWGLCIVRADQYAYERFAVGIYRLRDGAVISTDTAP